jgi:predicted DNA-binding transcriptional regulator YafY
LSILLFLQTSGRSTTARLAEELEVSRRTILRDLFALRVAGFPVYTERGPHGGCYLHEE